MIDATGVLTQPKLPGDRGRRDFAGVTMHTARWDPRTEPERQAGRRDRDRRVRRAANPGDRARCRAPEVFQRTPIWCLPKLDGPLPTAGALACSARVPGGAAAARLVSQSLVELTFPLAAHYHGTFRLATVFERRLARTSVTRSTIPSCATKLTPRYSLGCKRPSFHNEYLATFNRANVTLETDPIERITAGGVVTRERHRARGRRADTRHRLQGFRPRQLPQVPGDRAAAGSTSNGGGTSNRYQAYEGVSVPGFPNYSTMFGPYGYNGSSYFNLVETQSRHIIRCPQPCALSTTRPLIEVSREANDRYFAEMLRRRGRQIFWQPSCALANSYYFDPHGDVPFRPSPDDRDDVARAAVPARRLSARHGGDPGASAMVATSAP